MADKILTEFNEFTYSIGCSKRKGRDHSINLAQPGSICDMLPQQSRTMDDPGDLGMSCKVHTHVLTITSLKPWNHVHLILVIQQVKDSP